MISINIIEQLTGTLSSHQLYCLFFLFRLRITAVSDMMTAVHKGDEVLGCAYSE